MASGYGRDLGVITLAVVRSRITGIGERSGAAGRNGRGVPALPGSEICCATRARPWPIIPLTALNYAPAAGIRGLWAGPYLADVYGADALLIGRATLFMALAMIAGSFLYGPLDTIFRTRKCIALDNGKRHQPWRSPLTSALFTVTSVPETTVRARHYLACAAWATAC